MTSSSSASSLSTLLSQALVAFTIEFDDRFEQRMPHTTTTQRGPGLRGTGPWLVSQAMYTNYIRHIGDDGILVRDLRAKARVSLATIRSRLNHLSWWGYVTVWPTREHSPKKLPPYREHIVEPTAAGAQARRLWEPLGVAVEERWRSRFGDALVDDLVGSLRAVAVASNAVGLPHYLPVVEYGNGMRAEVEVEVDGVDDGGDEAEDVSALLSQVLLRLTLDVERGSGLSFPIAANVVRLIGGAGDDGGTSVRDLPLRAGVSKEAVGAALKFLERHGHVEQRPDPAAPRSKLVSLTGKGRVARSRFDDALAGANAQWIDAYGARRIDALCDALDAVLSHAALAEGLRPHEDSWRWCKPYADHTEAYLRDPRASLPHYPMVLHRGGFPDGS